MLSTQKPSENLFNPFTDLWGWIGQAISFLRVNLTPDYVLEKRQSKSERQLQVYGKTTQANKKKQILPQPQKSLSNSGKNRQRQAIAVQRKQTQIQTHQIRTVEKKPSQENSASLTQLVALRQIAKSQNNTKLLKEIDSQIIMYAKEFNKRLGYEHTSKDELKKTLLMLYETEKNKAASVKIKVTQRIAEQLPQYKLKEQAKLRSLRTERTEREK